VGFDPAAILIRIGPIAIPNLTLAVLFGIVLIFAVVRFYFKAVATRGLIDDLAAAIALYVIFRLEGDIAQALPLSPAVSALLKDPAIYVGVLTGFLIMILLVGQGLHDSRVFWKVVFEGLGLYLFFFPERIATGLAGFLDWVAKFGEFIKGPVFPQVLGLVLWGVLGLILLAPRLYAIGRARLERPPIIEEIVEEAAKRS